MNSIPPKNEHVSREEMWRDLICRIDGVRSARVIFDVDGTPKEVHVLADETKNPKQLTRDIQSALITTFEVDVDYRVISVARVPSDAVARAAVRLKYSGIDLHANQRRTTVTVRLEYRGMECTGASTASMGVFGRVRMVAQATVEAMNVFVGDLMFELVDVVVSPISGRRGVLAMLYCVARNQVLLGSTLVAEEDPDGSVAKAVLDAANRMLETLKH